MAETVVLNKVTRRGFMRAGAAFAWAHSTCAAKGAGLAPAISRNLAYVGTYTGGAAGGNGEGIYSFAVNAVNGELTQRKLVAKCASPSWIAIHPSKRYLYAANEVSDYRGNSGSVSAFEIDRVTGDLTPLNVVRSEGAGPCYLSIDLSGAYAFVANYQGGTTAVLPVLEGGRLGDAVDIHRDSDNLGASVAADAPTGSYAISGHDAPHAHMIAPDRQGRFVLATDLGQDRIYTYRFDRRTGKLNSPDGAPFTGLPSGNGPRHFAFHPNGHWLYAIQEEASNLVFFHYNQERGSLAAQQTVSTLPAGFAGTSFASEILISPDGRFLYAANRLHDSIATFSIAAEGRLARIGEVSTMGDYPVQCRIDPSGYFLYACNRHSDSITCFKVDRETGLLAFTGNYTAVGSPGSVIFFD
ncbi:MAG: lactonase family protein [Terracidiphilus sp.]